MIRLLGDWVYALAMIRLLRDWVYAVVGFASAKVKLMKGAARRERMS
ncbi:MAG: hypothetical protein WCG12_20650 [Alcaligenaceae bacterium]